MAYSTCNLERRHRLSVDLHRALISHDSHLCTPVGSDVTCKLLSMTYHCHGSVAHSKSHYNPSPAAVLLSHLLEVARLCHAEQTGPATSCTSHSSCSAPELHAHKAEQADRVHPFYLCGLRRLPTPQHKHQQAHHLPCRASRTCPPSATPSRCCATTLRTGRSTTCWPRPTMWHSGVTSCRCRCWS